MYEAAKLFQQSNSFNGKRIAKNMQITSTRAKYMGNAQEKSTQVIQEDPM